MKEEQILEAARKLFTKYGYKKVLMDEIAKEAGVTKRTVYSYFPSKEVLFKYYIDEELENMKTIIEKAEKQEDFFDMLHQGIYDLIQYKNKRKFLKVIAKEVISTNDAVLLNALSIIDKQIHDYILGKVELASQKGFIKADNPEITAFLIYRMYFALMFDWNENSQKLDENVIADNILEILKNGIGKKE